MEQSSAKYHVKPAEMIRDIVEEDQENKIKELIKLVSRIIVTKTLEYEKRVTTPSIQHFKKSQQSHKNP